MTAPVLVISGPSGAGKTTVGGLVASAFDRSAHIPIDDFMPFVVSGWVDPALAEAAHQNYVLGGAVAAAAIQFAHGGYTVIIDGYLFPDGLQGMVEICSRRGVIVHYAVLRPDLATCLARVAHRGASDADDPEPVARMHARFVDLGLHEDKMIDASDSPDRIAAAVLSAFIAGRLQVSRDVS